jgi:type I restriction enzyme M protein
MTWKRNGSPSQALKAEHMRRSSMLCIAGVFGLLQPARGNSDNSWSVDASTIDKASYDLSVKNPNKGEEAAIRSPREIMDVIAELDAESADILARMRSFVP